MPTKLLMPLLGKSVTDATITKWLKSTGDKVEEYEPLLEVNTDKVDTEIPSPSSGMILAEIAMEGEVVKVGALLGWIGQPGEAIPQEGSFTEPLAITTPNQPAIIPAPLPQPVPARELGFISPVVAKIAQEQSVDLSKVPGTGMGGRITKKDLEKYLETLKLSPVVPLTGVQSTSAPINLNAPQPRHRSARYVTFSRILHSDTPDPYSESYCRAHGNERAYCPPCIHRYGSGYDPCNR